MKLPRAYLLLLLAGGALVAGTAQAVNPTRAFSIDYTLTGLTAWNGSTSQATAQFDPTPDRPFRLTFNLNDDLQLPQVFSDRVEFSGVSPNGVFPTLSIQGASPL